MIKQQPRFVKPQQQRIYVQQRQQPIRIEQPDMPDYQPQRVIVQRQRPRMFQTKRQNVGKRYIVQNLVNRIMQDQPDSDQTYPNQVDSDNDNAQSRVYYKSYNTKPKYVVAQHSQFPTYTFGTSYAGSAAPVVHRGGNTYSQNIMNRVLGSGKTSYKRNNICPTSNAYNCPLARGNICAVDSQCPHNQICCIDACSNGRSICKYPVRPMW